MNKPEKIVLLSLCFILAVLSFYNYLRRERLKRDIEFIIEESLVPVSINEAGIDELTSLPGIGPSLASRIINYREDNGGFKCVEDIKRVKGIGPHIYGRIYQFIKL